MFSSYPEMEPGVPLEGPVRARTGTKKTGSPKQLEELFALCCRLAGYWRRIAPGRSRSPGQTLPRYGGFFGGRFSRISTRVGALSKSKRITCFDAHIQFYRHQK